jgi:beta-lactamase class A
MKYISFFLTILILFTFSGCSRTGGNSRNSPEIKYNQLRQTLLDTIAKYKAEVGLSVIELETGDTLSINGDKDFATQSVYKFPLALALLNKVEKGEISLNQKLFLSKEILNDYISIPLKRQNPYSSFYMSVDSALMYMIAYSDNLTCDLLFELIGGTKAADDFVHQKGYKNIHIRYTEIEVVENFKQMYDNSSTPAEMTGLLKAFYEGKIVNEANTKYLLNYMINDSTTHKRLMGNLPEGIKVAHKTGTGYNTDTLINACNDAGIIYLPNGNHLAVSIFIMNSKESYDDTERLIAVLAKQIYDYYGK